VLGSLAINNGQNLQAMGLARLARAAEAADPNWVPGTKIKPWKSRLWSIGMGVFIGGSLINFSAFTFAPDTPGTVDCWLHPAADCVLQPAGGRAAGVLPLPPAPPRPWSWSALSPSRRRC